MTNHAGSDECTMSSAMAEALACSNLGTIRTTRRAVDNGLSRQLFERTP